MTGKNGGKNRETSASVTTSNDGKKGGKSSSASATASNDGKKEERAGYALHLLMMVKKDERTGRPAHQQLLYFGIGMSPKFKITTSSKSSLIT
jgi:hypothetical protein